MIKKVFKLYLFYLFFGLITTVVIMSFGCAATHNVNVVVQIPDHHTTLTYNVGFEQ